VRSFRAVAAAVCSLGGLVFGYDLGALSATGPSLRQQFHLSPLLFGLTVAASLWGTVCGSIAAGRIADRIGRPRLVGICAALYLTAALTLSLAMSSWLLLLCLRFLCGAAIGGFTVGCPLYLAEIAPRPLRGLFVGSFQLQVGIGVVLAFAVGAVGRHLIPHAFYWRLCLGLGALPAALLILLLRYMSPSPHSLSHQHRWEEADRAADRLAFSENEWPRNRAAGSEGSVPQSQQRLFSRKYLRPILLATSIAVFNQLSGVNVLLLYLLDVLSSAGFNELLSHRYTVWISALNLTITLLSMSCVDKFGRRPLLLIGSFGMAICLFWLGVSIPHHVRPFWYVIILIAYNGFFAFSQGTVVWVYLSELFPFGVRGSGQGYATTVHWIASATLILAFPVLQRATPSRGFYFFAIMMIVQMFVIHFWYPETKGTALGYVNSERINCVDDPYSSPPHKSRAQAGN
jgi:SP family arabinose:H+ symporter-like MFS transporter